MIQTSSGNISNHDPVYSRRNQAHLDFRKSCVQNLRVLPPAHLLLPQKPGETIHQIDDEAVHLTVFLRESKLSLFLKCGLSGQHLFFH